MIRYEIDGQGPRTNAQDGKVVTVAQERDAVHGVVQGVMERFAAACREDSRVVAAFVSGSHAAGTADEHSDLDLGLVTTDASHEGFLSQVGAFVSRLGEVLFLESFGNPHVRFFVLADGTESELALGRESGFSEMAREPIQVLLDKTGILAGASLVGHQPDPEEQRETLRRVIVWFWHDVSHCITALGRGRLWWAYGQLEVLRRSCVNLLRLRQDFLDGDTGTEAYFKVELALPAAHLEPLRETLCTPDYADVLRAAHAVIRLYRALALPLSEAHGVQYPHALERVTLERLERLEADAGSGGAPHVRDMRH